MKPKKIVLIGGPATGKTTLIEALVAKLYNVSSIPATFIIDDKGIILAERLRGRGLEAKIAELLD